MDRELQAVLAALRLHAGNTCGLEALLEVIANLDVLMQILREILVCIPAGIPVLDNAKANAMGIYFLTQTVSLPITFRLRQP